MRTRVYVSRARFFLSTFFGRRWSNIGLTGIFGGDVCIAQAPGQKAFSQKKGEKDKEKRERKKRKTKKHLVKRERRKEKQHKARKIKRDKEKE